VRVVSWQDLISGKAQFPESVNISIGVFDGLHLGHRKLLGEIVDGRGFPLVLTFREHPLEVLSKGGFPGQILTPRQKMERMEALGVSGVVVIDFSRQLGRLSGKAFISLLRDNIDIGKIVAGHDFRFGKGREADADSLRREFRGTKTAVWIMDPVLLDGTPVSSSRIRNAILEGSFPEVREMLGAGHALDLRDISMAQESLPGSLRATARRSDIRQCLPKPGRYPVSSEAETAAARGLLTVGNDSVELELSGGGTIEMAVFL
jgi:riboflavin kinase/FMN adenylyltransferase